jgi:hypothetical protein
MRQHVIRQTRQKFLRVEERSFKIDDAVDRMVSDAQPGHSLTPQVRRRRPSPQPMDTTWRCQMRGFVSAYWSGQTT